MIAREEVMNFIVGSSNSRIVLVVDVSVGEVGFYEAKLLGLRSADARRSCRVKEQAKKACRVKR